MPGNEKVRIQDHERVAGVLLRFRFAFFGPLFCFCLPLCFFAYFLSLAAAVEDFGQYL
jgi:hypothetical protein